jgi:hypothetical protein
MRSVCIPDASKWLGWLGSGDTRAHPAAARLVIKQIDRTIDFYFATVPPDELGPALRGHASPWTSHSFSCRPEYSV